MNKQTFNVVNRLRTCKEYQIKLDKVIKSNNDLFEYYFKRNKIATHNRKERNVIIHKQNNLDIKIIEKINYIFEVFKFPYQMEQIKNNYYIKNKLTFQYKSYQSVNFRIRY